MKNVIALFICLSLVLLILIGRSWVYENTSFEEYLSADTSEIFDPKPVMALHFHERRPFYARYMGEVRGLVANPVSLVFKQADIEFEWIETPAARQLDIIKENASATCAAGWFKTPARERFAKFTLPVYQDKPLVAVTRQDNKLIKDIDLFDRVFGEGRLRFLSKSGYSYGKYIDEKLKKFSPWRLITTAGNKGMLKMILENRADYCLMTEEEAHDLLVYSEFNQADFKIIHFNDVPRGNKRYIICSKKVEDQDIAQLNNAIMHVLKIEADSE